MKEYKKTSCLEQFELVNKIKTTINVLLDKYWMVFRAIRFKEKKYSKVAL
jgi:hypothetical protein